MAMMVVVVTFQLCLGLLDDLSQEILEVIHPECRCNLLFWLLLLLLVKLLIDVGYFINEGLIEVRHDQLCTRNLTGDVIRLVTSIGELLIHRLEIGINLLIDLGHQMQHLTLHLPELFLDVPLVWRAIILYYFGEGVLVTLEFYYAYDALQAAEH